ncbi:MAG TPA: hypothetical protein VD866_06665 [Urbifossiella sp.]|nr:hypothetical protein [Urbifossiella sp.]
MSKLITLYVVAPLILVLAAGSAAADEKPDPVPGGFTLNRQISLGDVMNVVMALATIAAVVYAAKSFTADHERRRKQATMEHLDATSKDIRDAVLASVGPAGTPSLTRENAEAIAADPAQMRVWDTLLAMLERRSLGVNSGVYDFSVMYSMSASFLIEVYARAYEYMAYGRRWAAERKLPAKYYKEYEDLVEKLHAKRGTEHKPLPV